MSGTLTGSTAGPSIGMGIIQESPGATSHLPSFRATRSVEPGTHERERFRTERDGLALSGTTCVHGFRASLRGPGMTGVAEKTMSNGSALSLTALALSLTAVAPARAIVGG